MTTWSKILDDVRSAEEAARQDSPIVFFRGQPDARWGLVPSLLRKPVRPVNREVLFYSLFVGRAGRFLDRSSSPWDNLFTMRHHGVPTRLLDWSEVFSVALYFAVRDATDGPSAIWILNPIALNEKTQKGSRAILDAAAVGDYEAMFVGSKTKPFVGPVALHPHKASSRLLAQRAVFTVHGSDRRGIEKQCLACVCKVEIPPSVRPEAQEFLRLAGVDEYSVFPDLDGLARSLAIEEQGWR